MRSDIPILKAQLTSDVGGVVRALFTNRPISPYWGGWRVGNHGSLAIKRDGIWFCHESGRGGDVFELISFAFACDIRSALTWARMYVGGRGSLQAPEAVHHYRRSEAGLSRKRKRKANELFHRRRVSRCAEQVMIWELRC